MRVDLRLEHIELCLQLQRKQLAFPGDSSAQPAPHLFIYLAYLLEFIIFIAEFQRFGSVQCLQARIFQDILQLEHGFG